MEYIPVTMIRADLEGLPSFPLPAGYRIRRFRRGEEPHWAEVESAAGEFAHPERALARFLEEFGGPSRRWKSVASSWRRTPGV